MRFAPSPIKETFGISYIDSGPGFLRAEYNPGLEYTNAHGTIHGGILSLFLDHIMGVCCSSVFERGLSMTTTEFTIYFLEPAKPGRLEGEARILKAGRNVGFVEGEIRGSAGESVAKAFCSILIRRMSKDAMGDAETGPDVSF